MTKLIDEIFKISSEDQFNEVALKVFDYQYQNCEVYQSFCDALGRTRPSTYNDIPFLPIEFFKTEKVISTNLDCELTFKSSGTGGQRSTHYVHSAQLYQQSFLETYLNQIGNPANQVIVALLPNYVEQGESSLVYMVDILIQKSNNSNSEFLLKKLNTVKEAYQKAIKDNKQFVLFGVAYALLDLVDLNIQLPEALIIETGGMKGRRKELTKVELHEVLKSGLKCNNIRSEYGMTELLSQAYCDNELRFTTPQWMKVLIRDVNDPLSLRNDNKTGGINVIDLANLYSCSFIATQDLGRSNQESFEILGRFDNSDIRGCNLLVQ